VHNTKLSFKKSHIFVVIFSILCCGWRPCVPSRYATNDAR